MEELGADYYIASHQELLLYRFQQECKNIQIIRQFCRLYNSFRENGFFNSQGIFEGFKKSDYFIYNILPDEDLTEMVRLINAIPKYRRSKLTKHVNMSQEVLQDNRETFKPELN